MSDANASAVSTPNINAAASPKPRSRASTKRKPETHGAVLTVLGDRFVCPYSGRLIERGVRIPGLEAVFANLPCAVAWLTENVKDEKSCENFKNALCEEYEQQPASVVRAPVRTQLMDFGGDLDYETWMGDLRFWDQLTMEKGLSVKDLAQLKKGAPVKKKARKNTKIEFQAGMYVIPHNKGAKLVNALDGSTDAEPMKGKLTPVSAIRKLEAFRNSHKDITLGASCRADPRFIAHTSSLEPNTEVDTTKLYNKVASRLTQQDCYGPAVFIFTKKTSVVVE